MDGHIGQLDCRLRLGGEPGAAAQMAARLRRVAREQLPAAYAAALDAALEDDPAIYVLRQVDCSLALAVPADAGDAELARRWGEGLAGVVLRAIARGDEGCVSFGSQAEYVAHFCADLLRGEAWGRWYYGAFGRLRHLPPPEAARAALLDAGDALPQALGALQRLGALEALLRALDQRALGELWSRGMLPPALAPAEAQLFIAGAVGLIDRLGLWAAARPGPEILQAYLATRPPPASWDDRGGLAQALVQALRFLASRGLLARPPAQELPGLPARIELAAAPLDWLDTGPLRDELTALLSQPVAAPPERPRPPAATPRQRALLGALQALIDERGALLDLDNPDGGANAIRLHAWLAERDQEWAAGSLAAQLIERLLRAWAALAASPHQTQILALLRQGALAAALQLLDDPAPHDGDGRALALRSLVGLGPPALPLIERLLIQGGGARPGEPALEARASPLAAAGASSAIPTGCAGAALLLRAALDLRLPALLACARPLPGLPPDEELRAVLLALLLRLGGAAGSPEGRIDPGLRAMVGWADGPATLAELAALWAASDARLPSFQASLLRTLQGQRLIGDGGLRLHTVDLPGGAVGLVAGDEQAQLWPLGAVVRSDDEIRAALAGWRVAWSELTGAEPALPLEPGPAALGEGGRERLLAALAALGHGGLGLAAPDLTIGLAATALLRGWCRWLRNFGDSSVPYLLSQFIHRSGAVTARPDGLLVELAPLPLDVMLEISGYTAAIERVPWLDGGSVRFRMDA